MTTSLTKPLYTARATATGGRAGHAVSDDGILDVDLRPPKEMGGPGGATNPEQLFAVGYAACFQSALGVVGRRQGTDTGNSTVEADVTIGTIPGGGYGLAVALRVKGARRINLWHPGGVVIMRGRPLVRPSRCSSSRRGSRGGAGGGPPMPASPCRRS